jgi:hypothetical protein
VFRPGRRALVRAAVAILAVAGWAGWWQLAGVVAERTLAAKLAAAHDHGDDIAYRSLERGGFPLYLRLSLTEVTAKRRDGSIWRLPELEVETPLWWVTTPRLRFAGHAQAWLPRGNDVINLGADSGDGWVNLGGALGFTEAHLALTGATVQRLGADGAPPVTEPVTVAQVDLAATAARHAPTEHTETGLTVTVAAERLHVPLTQALPLGSSIRSLGATARVLGATPRLDPGSLAAWSQDGGTVELDRASLQWGPLVLAANGTLALDRDLQPIGALTAEITGFAPAIDALVATGWVKPKEGQAVKAVLTGLVPRHQGAALPTDPTARIPVSIHDGFIHVGPFRLAPLPAIPWTPPAAG